MWRSKKFIVGVVLAVVLLAGSLGGIALAADNGDGSQAKTLIDRVTEILVGKGVDITSEQLQEAFSEARTQARDEALDNYLEGLVSEGRITQEQADQYKTWLQEKPDLAPYQQQLREWRQAMPGIPSDLEEWQQNRPDVPMPGSFGRFGGHGGFRGMGGFLGFGGACAPVD